MPDRHESSLALGHVLWPTQACWPPLRDDIITHLCISMVWCEHAIFFENKNTHRPRIAFEASLLYPISTFSLAHFLAAARILREREFL